MEEAIRAMAIFGLIIFGAMPLANAFAPNGVPTIFTVLLPLPIVAFVLFTLLRHQTGRRFAFSSQRGWLLWGSLAAGVLPIAMALLLFIGGKATVSQTLMALIAILVSVAVIIAMGRHSLPLDV